MISATVTCLIDLGNSETRVDIGYMGKYRRVILPNRYHELQPNYVIPEEYRNNKTIVMQNDGVYIANGELVDYEFATSGFTPVGIKDKSSQVTSKYGVILSIMKAIDIVCEGMNLKPANVNWQFNIAVLLPPFEQIDGKDDMTSMIKSIKVINSIAPVQYSVPIEIKDIKVLPEGVVAFTSAMFHIEGDNVVPTVENEKFKKGYSIVLDIGAGTTDLVLVKDGRIIMNTKESFTKGGNFVISTCRTLMRHRFKSTPTVESMKDVIEQGVYYCGNDVAIVDDLLESARKSYAEAILKNILEYLDEKAVPVNELKGVLTVGGGSLPTVRDGEIVCQSMAQPLIEMLRQFSPSIESIHIDEPRYANLQGLRIVCLSA